MRHRFVRSAWLFLSLAALLAVGGVLPAAYGAEVEIQPKVGVYIKAEDIARARERMQTEGWARQEANRIISEANRWLAYPDEWYYEMIPPAGSIFAYGQTGCPVDGAAWPNFGGGGVASFDRPFTLRCPSTGTILDFDNPESPYYDPGPGVIIDGRRYYLRGVWNAYVTNQLAGWGNDEGAVHYLTYAYLLTGDVRYAEKALVIMDALATLMPTTIGPRDFQRSESSVEGRLHWLTSIVHRSKMHLIRNYDVLYNVPMMSEVSPTNPTNFGKTAGFTIRENIEENMIKDYVFGQYDLRNGQLYTLHNHEADELRGMLAAGIVLGIPEWIEWGFNAAFKFLENTVDRDGFYYETSLSYGSFAQEVYLDLAELAYNYDPDNYPGIDVPRREDFPYNLNLYDHPKLRNFIFGFRERVDAAGRMPAYGNSNSPTNQVFETVRQVSSTEWNQVERLYARTQSEEYRQEYAQWLRDASIGAPQTYRSGAWNLFHARDLEPGDYQIGIKADTHSTLFGGPTLAILRSGEGMYRRAVLLRGGTNMPHAHDDVLGLLIHAKGYELTGDLGYGVFGSPVHFGWGTRQVAHNLVVVNKGLNRNAQPHQVGPGGDVLAFAAFPGVSFVEMDAPEMSSPADGVETYRRGVALIDLSNSESYIVDLFRVVGGQTHDYSFHTLGASLQLEGIETQETAGVWTLWGLDDPDATFDEPGRSWGERILAGEHIRDLGLPGENVQPRNWVPAPGNGYGFIHNIKGAETDQPFRAVWNLFDSLITRVGLTILPDGNYSVYQGLGPNRLGSSKMGFLVVRKEAERDEKLSSMFTAVIEPYNGNNRLVTVRPLEVAEPVPLGTAFAVVANPSRRWSTTDYILSAPDAVTQVAADADGVLAAVRGAFGMIRTDAKTEHPVGMYLINGDVLRYGAWVVLLDQPAWTGKVVDVDYGASRLVVDAELPVGAMLQGKTVLFENDAYSRNTSYTISSVDVDAEGRSVIDLGGTSLSLSSGEVARLQFAGRLMVSRTPFPLVYQYSVPTRFMDGKLLVNERSGASGRVSTFTSMTAMQFDEPLDAAAFAAGDTFVIYDAAAGDTFRIPNSVSMLIEEREDGLLLTVTASSPLRLQTPFSGANVKAYDRAADAWVPVPVDESGWLRLDSDLLGEGSVQLHIEP